MKYAIFLVLIFSFYSSQILAQTNATWALTTNGNCTNTGYVSGSSIAGGGGIGLISYGTNGAYSNNWATTSLAAAQTAGDYYQYSLTATANISVTSFSLYTMYNHPVGMSAAVFYSINGGAYTQVGSTIITNQNYAQTVISGLNLSVLNGQTFSVRVYGWNANNNIKLFYNGNVVITAYWSNSGDYYRSYGSGNWNDINNWMSSPDNSTWYHASLYPTSAAASVNLINGDVLSLTAAASANNLNFTSGSITLGNNNLSINGTLTGTPYFTYSGSGVPSQTGTNSHVTVTTETPTSLPATLNTLIINPGTGNTVLLPNDVTTTNLSFTDGSLEFDGNSVTLAGRDFAIGSDSAELSELNVTLSNTANTWGGDSSIAHTWTTYGTVSDAVDVSLTYPESETDAGTVRVWKRANGDTGAWALVGTFTSVDNGDTRTLALTGLTDLGSSSTPWDWTISDITETLPVELSSFTGVMTPQNYVMLEWVTQSETGVMGYYLYRNLNPEVGTAERINAFITATNTSQETSYAFIDREATPGHMWYYWLQNIDFSGDSNFHGPVSVNVTDPGSITPIIPLQTGLQQIYPNPFNLQATILYGLAKEASITIEILNSKGAVVRKLVNAAKQAGNYRILWNGLNDQGITVTSGVYFVRMTSGRQSSTLKLVMMK